MVTEGEQAVDLLAICKVRQLLLICPPILPNTSCLLGAFLFNATIIQPFIYSVHQTEIQMDGFRSLAEGCSVEFVPQLDANGRTRATRVTGPDGSQPEPAPFSAPRNDDDDFY